MLKLAAELKEKGYREIIWMIHSYSHQYYFPGSESAFLPFYACCSCERLLDEPEHFFTLEERRKKVYVFSICHYCKEVIDDSEKKRKRLIRKLRRKIKQKSPEIQAVIFERFR